MPLRTIADLVRLNHGLRANCWPCNRWVDIDLDALIRVCGFTETTAPPEMASLPDYYRGSLDG